VGKKAASHSLSVCLGYSCDINIVIIIADNSALFRRHYLKFSLIFVQLEIFNND